MLYPNTGFYFFICSFFSSHKNVKYSVATAKKTKEHEPWCRTHKQKQDTRTK